MTGCSRPRSAFQDRTGLVTEDNTLWIPTTATQLWNDAIDPIAALFGGWGEDARWALGGGTLLAMRWGEHRLSTDLDIAVFPDQEVTLWTMHAPSNTALEKLTAQLATTGIRPWGDLDNPNQRRYERDGQHIDLFEARPVPPGEERVATVNGRAVKTLSTAQILHGKLARLNRAPVRDLYDFASALVYDPDALAIAVGLRHPTVLLQDTAITLARRDELRAAAATQLQGPEFVDVARDPAHPGLAAILSKTIVKMVAEQTQEGWAALARLTDGTSRPINTNPTDPTMDGTSPEGTVEVDAEHAERLIDTWTMANAVAEQTLRTYHEEELAKPWPSYTVRAEKQGLSLICRRDERTPLSEIGTGLTLEEAVKGERCQRRWHPCADATILERRTEQLAASREQDSARVRTSASKRTRRQDSIEP